MTLLEQKKMVASWMGGHCIEEHPGAVYFDGNRMMVLDQWNPQSDRNTWQYIFEHMSPEIKFKYSLELEKLLGITLEPTAETNTADWFKIHSAKAEICWKALVNTVEEMRTNSNQKFEELLGGN